jgi:hypothetical protein
MSRSPNAMDLWWRAPKGQAHSSTWQTAERIERQQSDLFDRFQKLEALYDPNSPDADGSDLAHVTENAIASNVDTVAASVGSTEIRARFLSDGADWQTQRRMRRLEWYSEEQVTLLEVHPKCRSAFKECAKKGNGLVKVSEKFGRPCVEHVLVENIIVDQDETRDGRRPRQLHQWDMVDADELIAMHPKFEKEIEAARNARKRRGSGMGRVTTSSTNQVCVLYSWRLPIGVKGATGYKAGRYTKTISGADLVDEKWEEDFFPFAEMTWTERAKSWYGISGAERIAGIQRALNKRNWQIERVLDQNANLTTYVRPADANLTVKTSRVGNIGVVKGDWPHTPNPPLVSAETYQSRMDLKESAQREFGQTSMAVHGAKPAGLDSGAALREFKDQTTTRYASQEEDFERLVLKTITLILWVCKKLGAKAPMMQRRSRFGARKLRWQDVDLGEIKVQIQAASTLNRTPAGRMQMVIEFAQAGIISTDQARRLMGHPDIESELSLYTAALEAVEHDLDELADGRVVMPEPFHNHEMCVWRGQREYLKWRDDGAPEEILEGLRQYIVTAAWFIDQKNQSAANANAAMGAPMPGPADVATAPPPGMADPAMTQPAAAFADQAMQLQAS